MVDIRQLSRQRPPIPAVTVQELRKSSRDASVRGQAGTGHRHRAPITESVTGKTPGGAQNRGSALHLVSLHPVSDSFTFK